MSEDLNKIREETANKLKLYLAEAEEDQYLGVRIIGVSYLLNRTSFIIKKGFNEIPGKVKITIFGDGNIVYTGDAIVKSKEMTYRVSKKTHNLPLKTYKRIAVIVTPFNEEINLEDKHNLFLVNAPNFELYPVDYAAYKRSGFTID